MHASKIFRSQQHRPWLLLRHRQQQLVRLLILQLRLQGNPSHGAAVHRVFAPRHHGIKNSRRLFGGMNKS
jgi:hypothetical protein